MRWNPQVLDDLRATLGERCFEAAQAIEQAAKRGIAANKGSVQPFVASSPDTYPFDWDGALRESIVAAQTDDPLRCIVVSDAVDMDGRHFSYGEHQGHWWDGWARDFERGYQWVKVCEPHWVEPRPFLWLACDESEKLCFMILSDQVPW